MTEATAGRSQELNDAAQGEPRLHSSRNGTPDLTLEDDAAATPGSDYLELRFGEVQTAMAKLRIKAAFRSVALGPVTPQELVHNLSSTQRMAHAAEEDEGLARIAAGYKDTDIANWVRFITLMSHIYSLPSR